MSSKPLTIFLSSTFSDLVLYREAVNSSVVSLQNHAEDMVYWSADERTAAESSLDKVRKSDLVILIVAHRYGSIPVGAVKSIVEQEYEEAREKQIPILAFIVDPSYAWPPDQIDYDADARKKLESFRRRVEAECVRHLFTTPESLSVAVTQAIANFDRRRTPATPNSSDRLRVNQEVVRLRADIRRDADLCVTIGEAEDGLPLVLKILRSQDLRSHLEKIAISLNTDVDDPPVSTIGNTLLHEGTRVWRETGLHDVTVDGKRTLCFVSYNTLSTSFTPSLALRLLTAANSGQTTARGQQVDHASFVDTSGTIIGPISARRGYDSRVQSSGGANRFLAVSVDSPDVSVVGWHHSNDPSSGIEFWRRFVNESILGFSGWTFELIESHSYDSRRIVATGDSNTYVEKVCRTLERPKYFENTTYTTKVETNLASLVDMILRAAQSLSDFHRAGYVHGDIKPQNILLSRNGVVLIDSLTLNEGDIPPGLSPDWASPEQLLMEPVSRATDIYPFGLMLTMVLGAELTGELTQYALPGHRRESILIPMLRNPGVYLEVENKVLSLEKRKPWFDFVERCLRYDPSERFEDIDAFVGVLSELCNHYPIEGVVEFEMRGTLSPELALMPDGSESPCRMVTDNWPSLQRPRLKYGW